MRSARDFAPDIRSAARMVATKRDDMEPVTFGWIRQEVELAVRMKPLGNREFSEKTLKGR